MAEWTKKSSSSTAEPLACPSCAVGYPLEERFCTRCGMPLVHMGAGNLDQADSARHEQARKIDPRYTEGHLVRVAGGRNQAEAELIQGMLLEEGVPSMLRRSAGFDVPDFLAAGPRDVMVPESGAGVAREVLLEADMAPSEARPAPGTRRVAALLLAVTGGGVLTTIVAWLLLEATG